jgi:uncharacterized protein YfaS (alpha-2-macroglobulin family)
MLRQQIITAAIAAVCFASCMKSKNEVTVISRNFENEIEQQQNLVFTFDRDLVPDSLTKLWDTAAYVRITPPVRGQFKWNSGKELMFSPYTGFRPSTDYSAELMPALLKHVSRSYFLPEQNAFMFHTPYLKLMSANGFWAVSEKNKGEAALKISLVFNYKVDPATVSKLVHISLSGQSKEFTVTTPEVSETITAVIEGMDRDKLASVPLAVTVGKGLKCIDSDYLTEENMEIASVVPSPDKLEITQATGEYDVNEAVVHVFTTQAVDENKIAQLISTEPKVKFSVEVAADGFYLKGGFTAGLSYQLTITRQLRGVLGGEMEKDFSQLVVFGALEPSISFVSKKGIYLSSEGSKNIAVSIVSVPKVRVIIKKVYENNIVHFMRSNRYHSYEDYYDDEEDGESGYSGFRYNNYNTENYSGIVFDQWYETKNLPKQNGVYLLNLSLEDEKKYKGIYLVNVASTDDLYRNDTKLVSISDIGLITKQTENEMYVFVNSIKTAEPMHGVEISFISSNNQNVYTATTNGDGVAEFTNMKSKAPSFTVAMVTAKQFGDFNYLLLDDSRVSNSRFDVGGRRTNSIGYMAFLYGDRNIYRPGETVYLNTIVRDEQWSPIGEVPVKIKMLLPNGKEYKTVKGTLDKQGAFATSFPLPAATVTGTYVAEVYSANDVLLQSRDISVEEFMPDRISVNLKLSKEDFSYNDTVTALVNAMNLFGPPAADRKYEVEYSLSYKYFSPKDFKGYNFSINHGKDMKFTSDLREGKTDENGNAQEDFKVDTAYKNIGVLEGKIFATVFDETGRPVNRLTRFDVFTQDIFYGVKMTDYYVPAGDNYAIPLIAVGKNGKALANAKAQVQVIRHDWYSVIERTEGGGYRWVSHENDRVVLDQEITLGKDGYILNYKPRESGTFEVRIMALGVTHYVSGYFYSYGHGYTSNTSFAVNTEGQVDITFDKEKYNVGDDANILFTTPFSGKLLVTVECDRLLESFYLNTDKKTASVTIPVKENYLPNVYVTATLFRPLDDGAIPMTVAHGFAPMIVNKASNLLPVTILAPEQSRSKMKQKITIKTSPMEDVELTVAVVDEGILQLKNYKTPDPYAFFYQKKALEVTSYDLYATILPDLKLKRSSPGGDGYDLEKRVNPLTNKRVKLVAFWSGILHTNSAGEASYTIDIPQFSGDLRIMVCAYKDQAFGSADKHMKVADPIVISPSIPRFLSPKDTLVMPVTLSNTTSRTAEATAKVSLTGALNMVSAAQQTVSIKPKSEQRVEFKILAATAIGTGSIGIDVNAFGENFSDITDITVRPSTSLLKVSDAGVISNSGSKTLKLKTDFIPSTVKSKLIISQNPMIQFTDQLNYLLGYPYGCLEQTTSKAFPQLYYTELVRNVKNAVGTTENPQYYVQEAVRKLETMQLYNGSLSYWPGGIYENWWGTTYATHFLFEAQKAGYEVNSYILDRCMTYLGQKVKEHLTDTYYYWDERNILRSKTIAWKENCYSLYILALYSKPDISSMNYYKSHLELLALDSRYLLACTYLAVGDRKSYYELLPKSFEGERSRNCFGGSFYSYVRDEAIALNALIENDPDNPQVGMMVRHLSQQLKKDRYLNTQERAFTFLALGKFMKHQRENKVTAAITVDGIPVDSFTGKDIVLTKNISGKSVKVNVNGYGNLYYFWEEEGLNAKGEFKEEDSYLKVRKIFYNRFGQPVSIKNIKQGDLIAVKISVQAIEKVSVENVVLTDMLPAGFEIENPRVGEVQDMNWIKDDSSPDYFDVRDDRINFFTTVDANPRNFYYLVRAVSLGNYVMGPVSADAMYDGEYHSYNGAGVVKIVK